MIQIIDNVNTIKLAEDGKDIVLIYKTAISKIESNNKEIIVFHGGSETHIRIDLVSNNGIDTVEKLIEFIRSISDNPGSDSGATAAKQDAQTSLLNDIKTNTGNIKVDADSINLNTDDLEAEIASTNTKLDTANLALSDISENTERGDSATSASVNASVTVINIIAINTGRKQVTVYNNSTDTLCLKYGSGASTIDFTWKLLAGEAIIEDQYTGLITGIWSGTNGNAKVTEVY